MKKDKPAIFCSLIFIILLINLFFSNLTSAMFKDEEGKQIKVTAGNNGLLAQPTDDDIAQHYYGKAEKLLAKFTEKESMIAIKKIKAFLNVAKACGQPIGNLQTATNYRQFIEKYNDFDNADKAQTYTLGGIILLEVAKNEQKSKNAYKKAKLLTSSWFENLDRWELGIIPGVIHIVFSKHVMYCGAIVISTAITYIPTILSKVGELTKSPCSPCSCSSYCLSSLKFW